MNNTYHAQYASLANAINGLVSKMIDLEKTVKKHDAALSELPTVRDVEQMIASHIVMATSSSARAASSPPAASPPMVSIAPPPPSSAPLPTQSTILSLDASTIGSAGAPLDSFEGMLLSEGVGAPVSSPSAGVEKKKIIKKKK